MKLSEYGRRLGVSYRTVWRYWERGEIAGAYQMPSGTVIVPNELDKKAFQDCSAVVYARVSSSENKKNLAAQAERLVQYCSAKGYRIVATVCEVGSGVNDQRRKLDQILKNQSYKLIVIEHKDRLTRFGFNYLKLLLEQQGRRIEVVNESASDREDLIADFTSIITSFCARIYGQRRSKRKTEQLVEALQS